MKNRLLQKKATALFLVFVLLSCLTVYADSATEELEYVQSVKEEDEQMLISTEERIALLEQSRGDNEAYLAQLSAQISELTEELTKIGDQLSQKEQELAEIETEIENLETEAADQYEDMKIRIQYLYENGAAAGTFVSMLSAGSFTEFLNRAENYSQLNRFDREMLENYENTLQTIRNKQEALLSEKEEILRMKEELSDRQASVQELYESAYNDMISCLYELDGAQETYAALIEDLQAREAQMNELLRQQYEAEAAALAAEQAALEAQAAQEALNEQNMPEEYPEEEEDGNAFAPAEEQPTEEQPEGQPEEQPAEETPQEEPSGEDTGSEESESPDSEEEASADEPGDMKYLGNFMLTAYCPCAQCCGAYATGYTASGTLATEGRTVAMGGVDFGTKLYINGHIYTVEDRGTAYGHVDIFFSSHDQALAFGLQYADVYVVND